MRLFHYSILVASLLTLPFISTSTAWAETVSEKEEPSVHSEAPAKPKADSKSKHHKSRKAKHTRSGAVAKKDMGEPPAEISGALPQAKKAEVKKEDESEPKVVKADKADDEATKPTKKTRPAKARHASTRHASRKHSAHKRRHARAKSTRRGHSAKPAAKKETSAKPPAGSDTAIHSSNTRTTCLSEPVSFTRIGQPHEISFSLTTCKGHVAPGSLERLTALAMPYAAESNAASVQFQPTASASKMGSQSKRLPALIHQGVALRLQAIATKFSGKTITLVSGVRPGSKGSPHSAARAIDLRIDGVSNEMVVGFCKTLKDTGCGYYPNSSFVHIDVRPEGSGHVSWIDISGPGEKAHYVKEWPLSLPKEFNQDNDNTDADELPENLWPSREDTELELNKDQEMSVMVASTQESIPSRNEDFHLVHSNNVQN